MISAAIADASEMPTRRPIQCRRAPSEVPATSLLDIAARRCAPASMSNTMTMM